MNLLHLYEYVIVPTLDHLNWYNLSGARLVLGSGLVESNLEYVRQLSDGPALGLFQMEPKTHDDTWRNFLDYRPEDARAIKELAGKWPPGPTAMVGNLWYATAMCRAYYLRWPTPLPAPDDAKGMARYHKIYYNTRLGATKVQESVELFQKAIDETPDGEVDTD